MALLRCSVSALPGKELKRHPTDHRVPGNLLLTSFRSSVSGLGTASVGQDTTYITSNRYIFALLLIDQTYCGAHPAHHPVGTGACFPEGKWRGIESDHSTPFSIEVKNTWKCASTLL